MSRINNSVAVDHAVRVHQQSGQIAWQNASRLLRVDRAQVAELVQQVVELGPTTEDLQRFIDVISQEVEDPGLELPTLRPRYARPRHSPESSRSCAAVRTGPSLWPASDYSLLSSTRCSC